MLSIFEPLKNNVPSGRKIDSPQIESVVGRLHYRATVIFLFTACLLVTCLEWIGNGSKINCVLEGKVEEWAIPKNVIETYCFIATTFIVPKHFNKTGIGFSRASYGVGAYNPTKDDVQYKAYYRWVPFVLFLQGILFYLPHILFKVFSFSYI